MTDTPRQTNNHPGSTIDAEIADLLDQYLREREQGRAVDRDQWLREHPEYAERLAECLRAAELFGGAETGGFDLPAEPVLPESIGDFEILSELGRGGMGVVYEAREKSLDRIVALKVMRFGIVDPQALDRFRREAETAGALHHTNIVPVYATGREGDTSWYAMQRIDGESLAARIGRFRREQTPPPLDAILDVGIQAADALCHAHERDVVHRDVKPANLILDQEDRVWLTDFGLARRLVDAGATVTGAILGTPRYMSPEQADLRSTDVDHRSDIYSLGATLYEMATTRPPFEGDDPLSLITKIRNEDPPALRTLRSDLPRDLEVVLHKTMEKDACRRYQSAAQFADDLRAVRDDHPIHARPLSTLEKAARWTRKHQSRVRVVAAAMAVTAVLIAALLSGIDQWRERQLGSFRVRAGGGPYEATIVPVGESALSDATMEVTLPMQNHRQRIAGDYDMMVAPTGRWSQTLRLPITRGMPSEYRITSRPDPSKQISINDAAVVTVSDESTPAILWRRDGVLKRVTWDADRQWELDVHSIDTTLTDLDGSNADETETIPVNFADTQPPANFDPGHRHIDDQPLLTQGVAALRTPIDLDGDQRTDTLVVATDQQALLAVDHRGNILWSRSYAFANLPSKSTLPNPYNPRARLRFPGIFDLQDVGDRDDDGISDLFVMFVHYRIAVQTDVCLAVVSGKTGAVIRRHHQVVKTPANGFWPADAIFHPDKHQYRSFSGLSFSADSAFRAGHRQLGDFFTRHTRNGTPIRVPVPSPPQVLRHDDSLHVVLLIGDQCHLIDWDQTPASAVTITLPFMPARAPRIANPRGDARLIFHDHQESRNKTARFSGTEISAYDLSGVQQWSRQMDHVQWRNSIDRNHADWPYVTDINGDGADELIVPRSGYRNGVDLGVQLLDAATGMPIWTDPTPYTALRSVDDGLCRITVTDDINDDGCSDIATAVIAAEGSRQAAADLPDPTAYVYVDWISGKSGKVLGWARHRIPVFGDQIRVAQIDAIRSGFPETPSGTIEIDFVTGDRSLDVMLESTVIRFHPSRPTPVAIAAGLDVCPSPTDSTSPVRVYRRRGGPFGVGEDHLVLLRSQSSPLIRLGETTLLASWAGASGRPLIAASGFQPTRTSVIDAVSGQTVWNSDRADGGTWIPIKHHDGRVDFLVQDQTGNESPSRLVDGETGAELCRLQDDVGGRVILVESLDDRKSILIVGDGRLARRTPAGVLVQPVNAFQMSLISRTTGEIRWSHPFLFGASRINTPTGYDHLKFADVNGDGVQDIVGPHSHDDQLFLAAWDGSNGEMLWERSVYQRPTRSDYWIPFALVAIDGQTHVVYLGATSAENTLRKLVLCGPDGKLVDSIEPENAESLVFVDGAYASRYLAIADATSSDGAPMLALSREANGKASCQIFDLSGKQFQSIRQFNETAENFYVVGMWFFDIDNDGVKERVVMDRVTPPQDESTPTSDRRPSLVIRCYPMLQADPRCRITIPDANGIQRVYWKWDHNVPISWLHLDQNRLVAIDWSRQQILTETSSDPESPSNVPLVCRYDETHTRMVSPTLDGIAFQDLHFTAPHEAVVVTTHREFDPRRMRPLFASIGGDITLGQWGLNLLRGGLALGILLILPLWYLKRTLAERRWSLAWLLLAPLLVGIWMVIWQSPWLREPNLLINLLNGVTAWMCGVALLIALRDKQDGRGDSIRLMLSVGTPVVFLALVVFAYLLRPDPQNLRHTVDVAGIARVALFSFAVVVQIYWILRILASAVHRIGRLLGRQAAT
ncbi:Serine/threonine-protein kinase PknB [Stieleria neptunia]|uniref:non-specific serine/threonine protein kinase n=1 Tax=Stieleria neptunia TaxID=2527979 RepID=A0A518I2A6_9BACT|nr:serine/threonine-protein kinase [Stieleria neptunia]QDV47221.1 Serine/threonine-protein kinase PknB [Stieleria neptunia]